MMQDFTGLASIAELKSLDWLAAVECDCLPIHPMKHRTLCLCALPKTPSYGVMPWYMSRFILRLVRLTRKGFKPEGMDPLQGGAEGDSRCTACLLNRVMVGF
eukprot:5624253-Amphidinium_carterae.2